MGSLDKFTVRLDLTGVDAVARYLLRGVSAILSAYNVNS